MGHAPSSTSCIDTLSELVSPSIETISSSESKTSATKLHLLQPLASEQVLAACRAPRSRDTLNPDGTTFFTRQDEPLALQPLNQAWRAALKQSSPVAHVIFDITLPQAASDADKFHRVYWAVAMPADGYLSLDTQRALTLAVTLATALRMRMDGELRFDVVHGDDGLSERTVQLFRKQIGAIARYEKSRPEASGM